MKLTPYHDYKDSGLPWLGKVPRHWEMRPAFGAYEPIRERNRGMKEKTVLSLSYGRIITKPEEKLHGLIPESFETYQIVNPGDIVLRTTDLQNDHTSLRVGMVRDRGIITSAYLALRVKARVSADFGYQFLNVWDMSKAIYGYGSGLRQNLDFTHFKRMPVAVPPPDEQAAIVRFLDYANGRLEKTIRAKRKVIALLNEQKQAIIHRAVTRGLDPNVPFKPSGIPWLGDIPKHWAVTRLRQVVATNPSKSESAEIFRQNSLVSFLPMERVSVDGQIDPCEIVPASYVWNGLTYFRRGDVIVAKITPCFENGKGAYLDALPTDIGFGSTEFHVLRPSAKIAGHYLRLITSGQMFLKNGANVMTGSAGQQRVPTDFIKNYPIPLPPLMEQEQIFKRVSEEVRELAKIISRTEREIALLREYRTRLISDVVTGKLDVREAARNLPEEADETLAAGVDEVEAGESDEVEEVGE